MASIFRRIVRCIIPISRTDLAVSVPKGDYLTTYSKSVVIPSLSAVYPLGRPYRYAEGRLMSTITGGCLCGQVRYTLTGEPIHSYVCHCRDCQRATAAPLAAGIAFPASSVSLQGELKTFDMAGGSGQTVHRTSSRTAVRG